MPTQQGSQRAFWSIVPTPAPRQVRRDAFEPSRSVQRYRAFRDECRWKRIWRPEPGDLVVFCMPIPRSRVREGLDGRPHLQKPDVDNLLKALLDALYDDDCAVWTCTAAKVWSTTPGIFIERRPPAIALPWSPSALVKVA